MTPSPATRHQRISGRLFYLLQSYLEAHPIGEVFTAPFDVLLSRIDIVVPDLVFIANTHSSIITSKNLQGAPNLVIEILSPSTRAREDSLKRDLYDRAGVEEYWLVDPDEDTIVVYRRGSDRFEAPRTIRRTQNLTTPLLPGFELPLEHVFSAR